MKKKRDYELSSGNVFADIGLPNPEEALVKAELALRISTVIRKRRLTQAQAAQVLRVDQPKISALIRGRLAPFSIRAYDALYCVAGARCGDFGEVAATFADAPAFAGGLRFGGQTDVVGKSRNVK
jgi:predicted XRE-type DNA-binding protein